MQHTPVYSIMRVTLWLLPCKIVFFLKIGKQNREDFPLKLLAIQREKSSSTLLSTFFIIMTYDCILYHISEIKTNSMILSMFQFFPVALPFLESFFSFVICLYLVTAHPLHQPLPLAEREGLQQALLNFHLMGPKNIT